MRPLPIFLFFMLALAGGAAPTPSLAQSFVTGTEDVPLMAGLTEDEEAAVVFDTPGGRIVEAAATGPMNVASVRDFYRRSLSSLGWTTVDGETYLRGDETLRVVVTADGSKGIRVAFQLAPAGNGASSGG